MKRRRLLLPMRALRTPRRPIYKSKRYMDYAMSAACVCLGDTLIIRITITIVQIAVTLIPAKNKAEVLLNTGAVLFGLLLA
jgi:hypothetical protein